MSSKRFRRLNRPGYLLITVLVMIAVASLMLSRVAGMSMRVASIAVAEEREMRNRWAITSLRRYALDTAPTLLRSATVSGNGRATERAQPVFWRDIPMAGHTWRILVADESAKVNVQKLMSRYDDQTVTGLVNELILGGLNVRANRELGKQTGRHWDQWLDGVSGQPRMAQSFV